MILRRLGNKKKLAKQIQSYFPPHKIYIEPFFGAGGMFFNKPKAKYNIVNDLVSDVFNLFQVVMNQKEELKEAFYLMPIHSDLLEYWKENKETEPIKKALRFLFLSNLVNPLSGFLHMNTNEDKPRVLDSINYVAEFLFNVTILNVGFKQFIKNNYYRHGDKDKERTLIYCDPPYLGTTNNYSNSFTEQDSIDLFDCLESTGCKWAMSEFNNPFILEQAEQRGLNVHIIGERQNLKNRRTEILITNYEVNQSGLFN